MPDIVLSARIKKISGPSLSTVSAIVVAIFLDQVSKYLVYNFLTNKTVNVIGGIVRLHMVLNTKGIFGLSFGSDQLYILFPIIGIAVLTYLFLIAKNKLEAVVVGFIIGGAIGNLIDRIRLDAVIDFIDMGIGNTRWPVYNLADAFITVGIIILLFHGVGHKKEK